MKSLRNLAYLVMLLGVGLLSVIGESIGDVDARGAIVGYQLMKPDSATVRTPLNSSDCRACVDSFQAPYDTTGLCADLDFDWNTRSYYLPAWARDPDTGLSRQGAFRVYALKQGGPGLDTLIATGLVYEGTFPLYDSVDELAMEDQALKPVAVDTTLKFTFDSLKVRDRARFLRTEGTGRGILMDGAVSGATAFELDGNASATGNDGRGIAITDWENKAHALYVHGAATQADSAAIAKFYMTGSTSGRVVEIGLAGNLGNQTGLYIVREDNADADSSQTLLWLKTAADSAKSNSVMRGLLIDMPMLAESGASVRGLEIDVADADSASFALYVSDGKVVLEDTLDVAGPLNIAGEAGSAGDALRYSAGGTLGWGSIATINLEAAAVTAAKIDSSDTTIQFTKVTVRDTSNTSGKLLYMKDYGIKASGGAVNIDYDPYTDIDDYSLVYLDITTTNNVLTGKNLYGLRINCASTDADAGIEGIRIDGHASERALYVTAGQVSLPNNVIDDHEINLGTAANQLGMADLDIAAFSAYDNTGRATWDGDWDAINWDATHETNATYYTHSDSTLTIVADGLYLVMVTINLYDNNGLGTSSCIVRVDLGDAEIDGTRQTFQIEGKAAAAITFARDFSATNVLKVKIQETGGTLETIADGSRFTVLRVF
jgi:hypothetical protein